MKKVCLSLCFVFAMQLLMCNSAGAQLAANCTNWYAKWFDWPSLPGMFDCVPYPGTFVVACRVYSPACQPPKAGPETNPGCSGSQGQQASKPVCLATGNVYIEETDIRIPGLGGGLTVERTWNSLWPATQTASQVGLFGPNWRSTFEERVFVGTDNYIKYARSDGSFWSFGYSGGGWGVAAPANVSAFLTQGTSYWTLTFQNGEQRTFDNTSGNLLSITDRNGNTTQLSYDGIGRLTTVTDPASRQLSFSYGSDSSFLVTSVTSNFGVSVSYSYDTNARLLQVTEPDSSTLTFQYNSQSLITTVLDSNNKVLESHTYDSLGRGLTSSRANGVEALTITYQ